MTPQQMTPGRGSRWPSPQPCLATGDAGQLIIAPFRQSYAKGQTPNPKGFLRWNLLFKWFYPLLEEFLHKYSRFSRHKNN